MPELLDPNEIFFTSYEPKQINRFVLYIEGVPAFIIHGAERPKIEHEVTVLHHINVNRKVKGKSNWNDISLTLYDPIVPSAAQSMMEWIRLSHESLTGRDGYADFYKKDLTLNLLGPVGDKIEEWTLKGAFINNYEPGALDWETGGAVKSTVVLSYDYAILQY